MGGIAGMIRFDGQLVDPVDTENMIRLLAHRGTVVSQPIDQGVLIAFGGTIETDATGVAAVDADVFTTSFASQPFTAHYAQGGPASFNDLNADFAVALWDARQQTLCCSRDCVGAKPLYYVHQINRFFAFATEIKALTVLREVAVQPNRHKFREYLTWAMDYVPYGAETFYEDIFSVLPGHYLLARAETLTELPYWQIDGTKFAGLRGIDEYSAVFRESFTAAVDNRIRGKQRVGSHLSGGLDSSSVSCVAQSLLIQQQRSSLYTFNIDPEQASSEEQAYVQAVVDQWHPHHYRVKPVTDVLDSVLKINALFDRPEHFIIPSSFHLSVSLEARNQGCDLLLTGHDGDSVIAPGFEYLEELVNAGEWDLFKQAGEQFIAPPERNLYYVRENWLQLSDQTKYEQYMLTIVGSQLKKQFRQQSMGTFFAASLELKKRFGLSESAIISYVLHRLSVRLSSLTLVDSALSEDFKRAVPNRSQRSTQKMVSDLSDEHHISLIEVVNTGNVTSNEQMNHIGAYYGHPYSFPFFDKQVIELGMATPMSMRFDNGRGRGLIRHGLRDVLPASIVSRFTKANFVEYGTSSAQDLYNAARELFSSNAHPIWEIIDRRIFEKIVAVVYNPRFPARRKTRYNWLLGRVIYLALWLGSLEKH